MMKELIASRLRQNNSGGSASSISELEKYLAEDSEDPDKKIDILGWWKENSSRFPILANMARDILAIPISSVASEQAFSMSRKVITPNRASLKPKTIEALMCLQDWYRWKMSQSEGTIKRLLLFHINIIIAHITIDSFIVCFVEMSTTGGGHSSSHADELSSDSVCIHLCHFYLTYYLVLFTIYQLCTPLLSCLVC